MIRKMAAFAALALVVSLAILGAPPATADVPTGQISGTVTVPVGANPAHVTAYLLAPDGAFRGQAFVQPNGSYSFIAVQDGTYLVFFRDDWVPDRVVSEYAGGAYHLDTANQIVVSAGGTVHQDAALEQGAALTVSVADERGPVSSAPGSNAPSVTIHRLEGDDSLDLNKPYAEWSGSAFTTSALLPGTYTITLAGTDWVSKTLDVVVGSGTDSGDTIVVNPGATRTVDVTLELKGRVAGTVSMQTPGGTTPWNGTVYIVDPTDLTVRANRLTQADGTFEVTGIDDGTYKVMFGQTLTTPVLYWPSTPLPAEASTIAVSHGQVTQLGQTILQQAGRVQGQVKYEDANGVLQPASVRVEFWRLDESDGTYEPLLSTTTPTGTVDMALVPAGTYAIWARPTDVNSDLGAEWHTNARYFADRVDVVVAPGATVQFTDMVLEPRYFDTWRTAGPDRFATAVEISHELFPVQDGQRPRPAVVYLVNAYNYPDALAAGPAAIRQGGAILPVAHDFAPESILAELADLNPVRIVVAGGVNAVADTVMDQVRNRVPGAAVVRIGEATRYETGRAIVQDAFGEAGSRVAFIATGRNYPDALAAGAAAGYLDGPVILVDGLSAGLDAGTTQLLTSLGVHDVYIAGGGAVVSAGVESALVGLLGADHVHRLAGNDRFETAAAINTEVFGDHFEIGFIASGYSFPDALAGGPLAAAHQAPMYLSPKDCMPDPTFFGLWDGQAQGIWLLGGEAVLGPEVEQLAEC